MLAHDSAQLPLEQFTLLANVSLNYLIAFRRIKDSVILNILGMEVSLMTVHNSPLEQFTLLAKSARGAAAVELIKQALEVFNIYRLFTVY